MTRWMHNSNRNALLWCFRIIHPRLQVINMENGTVVALPLSKWQLRPATCKENWIACLPRKFIMNAAINCSLQSTVCSTMELLWVISSAIWLQIFCWVLVIALGASMCHYKSSTPLAPCHLKSRPLLHRGLGRYLLIGIGPGLRGIGLGLQHNRSLSPPLGISSCVPGLPALALPSVVVTP